MVPHFTFASRSGMSSIFDTFGETGSCVGRVLPTWKEYFSTFIFFHSSWYEMSKYARKLHSESYSTL